MKFFKILAKYTSLGKGEAPKVTGALDNLGDWVGPAMTVVDCSLGIGEGQKKNYTR